MTRTLPQRERTQWDLRLKLYPFIAFALLAVVLVRVATEQAPQTESSSNPGLPAGNASVGSGSAVAAYSETVQGMTPRGAYVLERNPPWPMIEFTMMLTAERR